MNSQITNTLNCIRVKNACWRFQKLQSFYHIQFSINEQHINNYRNVRGIMSRCCQIRCTMWPLPSFVTYSNRICHWSIELLINIFVSPIHMTLLLKVLWCFHIALSSCRASFSWCPKLHNQVNWGHKNKEISFAFWYYQGHLHWDNSQQNLLCGKLFSTRKTPYHVKMFLQHFK